MHYLVTHTLIHPFIASLGLSSCAPFSTSLSFVVFCSPLELRCCWRQWRWRNPSELINLEASVSRSVIFSWTNGFYPWNSSDEECYRPGLSLVIPFWFFVSFFLSFSIALPPHENALAHVASWRRSSLWNVARMQLVSFKGMPVFSYCRFWIGDDGNRNVVLLFAYPCFCIPRLTWAVRAHLAFLLPPIMSSKLNRIFLRRFWCFLLPVLDRWLQPKYRVIAYPRLCTSRLNEHLRERERVRERFL